MRCIAGMHQGRPGRTTRLSTWSSNCRAKPGRRDKLEPLESLIATQAPGQDGFLGSTRYGVLDDPDVLVEIADWESAKAREAHVQEVATTGAYAPFPISISSGGQTPAGCRFPASGYATRLMLTRLV